MLLIIRFIKLSGVLYNSLIVPIAIALLLLVMPVIKIRVDRFYIDINTNKSLIIY